MALCDKEFLKIKSLLINYCNNCFFPEVGWPAYWWRNHLYSTWHMLELYERLELSIPKEIDKIAVTIDSIFDLSWSLGILHKLGNLNEVLEKPLLVLFNLQESSGKWPGGANLRVTDPECLKPWINPTGNYYIDINGTITTASALSVLSKF